MRERLALEPGEVGLFGYGSLLLRESMERTLGRPYGRSPVPCRVRGWRRTWDSLYPNSQFYYLEGDQRRYPANIIYLNVSPANGAINGLLYVIGEGDLEGFDRREATYSRVDVRNDLIDLDVEGGPVWMYVTKPEFVLTGAVPPTQAAIRRSYIDIVEAGLATLDVAFRDEYARSSDVPPAANVVDDRKD